MYFDFLVKIPEAKGKITYKPKGPSTYVSYEYDREYDRVKQYNVPKRAIIGKQSKADAAMMQPNENFLKYFPEVELPDEKFDSTRSSCLKIGSHIVIEKMLEEYKIPDILEDKFSEKDLGLFLDLMAYTITCENNAGQYYPDYAYNHPLFTKGMRIYSDTKVSEFLNSMSGETSVEFLNDWNASCDHREKIYISYDSTNKNCQAGEIELVEYGHPKVDTGDPVLNYSVAYDTNNAKPLFYEAYPGSIADVSQLEYALDKAKGYGYKNIGFILDRGYFSKDNIRQMDDYGYDFVIMLKGMSAIVNRIILTYKGTFEESRHCFIRGHRVYGMTKKQMLYADDEKERYFHIYYDTGKAHGEREDLEGKIERQWKLLKKQYGRKYIPGPGIERYFKLYHDKEGVLTAAKEKTDVIELELKLCGYFCIVTSAKMTAAEAIDLYYKRDASEKLFRGDKSYLGDKSIRVYSDESADSKIFIEFVALIVRNRIYTKLKEEACKYESKPNFMTVPAALKELDKIEMIRGYDRTYRLDHAVTKTQKMILNAFGMDETYIKVRSAEIGEALKAADRVRG